MSCNKVKCVVWDLDNTIWDGTIIEDDNVVLNNKVVDIIETLDKRGILQSICSKNDFDLAMNKLKELRLDKYFLYPQINWNPKSEGIKNIAKSINIGVDTLAFVDDQEFELDEVKYSLPEVLLINAKNIKEIPNMPEMNPKFITSDSKNRRLLYQNDIKRNKIEEEFLGTKEDFLKSLDMKFTLSKLEDEDLKRAEELTVRTHQLNATGYTYSYEQLYEMSKSDKYFILMAQLDDRYGTYGKIGLAVIELGENLWTLKLLLMSCRVVSRGVGTIILNYIARLAQKNNVRLLAEFVKTDRNRMMYITYKFGGFKEILSENEKIILEADYSKLNPMPDYIEVIEKEELACIS
ncbi:HAD-superfamily phosphatase, subfamily IIIC/FkbH-like domain-containing protein [Clostridium cavendishii DSM 21758]|uniref:HAD-superfamily phosphatase, subfamily IIIC/FkbH-like domain-containing protein n=1 Tax=Clostridium cavendishii DSM 21758 TaxID=1121302 RepID=A0A1M6KVW0_9CLOT|nr:HAD-IIIC family phosphatase [Clostridium cavendishii]SHJ63046.1 HAD-superfamily phosphatase, subfamily IIIC/FkbH-like domain-containing protein [Clostridium cavendishii DSM 21758]